MKNAKKLMLFAFILGIGLVFTQSAFKSTNRTLYTFRYVGADYLKASVENESNWIYDSSAASCDDSPEQACTIKVDAAFVNNPTTTPSLKSSLNLVAALHSPGSAYVESADDDQMEIINRSQP
eukprot:GILI01068826.1.p1 GENE.GILI01068826.1~~GILI01068826.1.p1  ORF type:complete len:123 (+),score=3.28 GILI01068826.1:346-714(+)